MLNYLLLDQSNKNCVFGISKRVFENIGLNILKSIDDSNLDKNNLKNNSCKVNIIFNKVNFNFIIYLKDKNANKDLIKSKIVELLNEQFLYIFDGLAFETNTKFLILKK